MKKTIVKFTGLAALAALMVFNLQFFNADSDASSGVKISYLENIAYASSSGSSSNTGGTGIYDETLSGFKCSVTWDWIFYKVEEEGIMYKCVSGKEWFCNDGCYTNGDSPS